MRFLGWLPGKVAGKCLVGGSPVAAGISRCLTGPRSNRELCDGASRKKMIGERKIFDRLRRF